VRWCSHRDLSRSTIRAELFSVERVEEHGRSLAEARELSGRHVRLRRISRRLVDNGEVLPYRELPKAIREEALLTPEAVWLVDNFHLVESQLHAIHNAHHHARDRHLMGTASRGADNADDS